MCSDQDTEESHAQPGKTRGGRAEGGTKADPYSSSAKIYSQKKAKYTVKNAKSAVKNDKYTKYIIKKASAVANEQSMKECGVFSCKN